MTIPEIVSAMAIVVTGRKSVDGPKVLLVASEGEWMLPKGRLEAGESVVKAAIREVMEETSVELSTQNYVTHLWNYSFFFEKGQIQKRIEVELFEVPYPQLATPNLEEGFSAAEWVSLAEAIMRLTHEDAREVLKRAAEKLESI